MSNGSLTGKRALVTGSTRGLGKAIAHRLAREGAAVMVSGRSTEDGRAVVDEIRGAGGTAEFINLDLTDEASVKACVDGAAEALGGLDVLVNNAAPTEHISGVGKGGFQEKSDGPIGEMTTERWRRVMIPAVDGLMWSIRDAIPHLLSSEAASIVNISTIGALLGMTSQAAYVSSKGAMHSLTRAVAAEYAPTVRCNCLVSGTIMSPALEPVIAAAAVRKAFEDNTLLGRIGEPHEMAAAVAFFASDDSSFITGQVLPVDGGQTIKFPIPLLEHTRGELEQA